MSVWGENWRIKPKTKTRMRFLSILVTGKESKSYWVDHTTPTIDQRRRYRKPKLERQSPSPFSRAKLTRVLVTGISSISRLSSRYQSGCIGNVCIIHAYCWYRPCQPSRIPLSAGTNPRAALLQVTALELLGTVGGGPIVDGGQYWGCWCRWW